MNGDRAAGRVAQSLRRFDNHDPRLPYYELVLERSLEALPSAPLPPGYHFEAYAPGDEERWIGIELSARELTDAAQGREVWRRYFGGHEDGLPGRMLFVADDVGQKVATATAYYDIRRADDGVNGMLHWVAVRRESQGLGLSKPLILRTLNRMRELGYRRAVIPTQTTTWLACKIYLDLGFRPIPRNAENSRAGWEIVKALTGHPALNGFAEADLSRYAEPGPEPVARGEFSD